MSWARQTFWRPDRALRGIQDAGDLAARRFIEVEDATRPSEQQDVGSGIKSEAGSFAKDGPVSLFFEEPEHERATGRNQVVDFTRVLAGPLALIPCATIGSEVIKIEPPGGMPAARRAPYNGMVCLLCPHNAGKRILSLTLNWPRPRIHQPACEGCRRYRRNFSPGTLPALDWAISSREFIHRSI